MADAHLHLKVDDEAFDAVVAHLCATLAHLGVPPGTVEAIAGRIAPLRNDIVSA